MRSRLSIFLLAPFLSAQPQGALSGSDAYQRMERRFEQWQRLPAEQQNYWHFQAPPAPKVFIGNPAPPPRAIGIPPRNAAAVQARACSIPLINALKGKPEPPDRMSLPRPRGKFSVRYVPLPAPPCDDGKR